MRFERTDIRDKKEFVFEDDLLKQKECVDEENHIYVYERYYHKTDLMYIYEIVRGVRHKNPDGNIVYLYPSSEQFGSYGYTIPAKLKDRIPVYVKMLQDSIKK